MDRAIAFPLASTVCPAALWHESATGFFTTLSVSISLFAAERLPRLDLLKFRDGAGKVQPVNSPADWAQRRVEILKGMTAVMGALPLLVLLFLLVAMEAPSGSNNPD